MWEERFGGIDGRLDRLEAGQTELRADVNIIKVDVADLKVDVAEIRGDITRLDNRVDTLDRHMHVLHEETISRIAAISEEPLATRSEMNRGFSELKELISRRIDPLEMTVRDLVRERNRRA